MAETPMMPNSLHQIPKITASSSVSSRGHMNLSGLPKGGVIDAVVIRQDSIGNPVLKINVSGNVTSEITVQSKSPLPVNSSLVLKVLVNTLNNSGNVGKNPLPPDFQAQILTINGKSLQTSQSVAGADILRAVIPQSLANSSNTTPSQSTATSTNSSIVNISNGAILNAIVINPSSNGAEKYLPKIVQQGGGNLQAIPLKASDNITIHVLSSNIAESSNKSPTVQNTSNNPINSPENARQIASYNQLQGNNPTAQTQSQSILQQNQIARNSLTPNTLDSKAQTPLQANSINQITQNTPFTGIVVGTEKSGESVIKTPLGMLKISTEGAFLPKGTILTLEALALKSGDISNIATTDQTKALSTQKSMIQEVFNLMKSIDSETNSRLVSEVFPHTGNEKSQANIADKQAAAKILWFLVNIQGGNAVSWLGSGAKKTLENSEHKDIINRLEKAFSALKTIFTEAANNSWNTALLPIYDGEKLHFGSFHSRRNKKENSDGTIDEDIRFIVEIELDSLGEIQLDGLVKTHYIDDNKEKSLDLLLRTRDELPNEMKGDMIDLFINMNEVTGLKGTIDFRVEDKFNVQIHEGQGSNNGGILA